MPPKPKRPKRPNISWRGSPNHHLVNILSREYHTLVSPPAGSAKKGICITWAKTLEIGYRDLTDEKVKQGVDKLISTWQSAHKKRMSTGFGDLVDEDGDTIT